MRILFLVSSKKRETVFGRKESEFIMSPIRYFFSLSFILLPIINMTINSVAFYETKYYVKS